MSNRHLERLATLAALIALGTTSACLDGAPLQDTGLDDADPSDLEQAAVGSIDLPEVGSAVDTGEPFDTGEPVAIETEPSGGLHYHVPGTQPFGRSYPEWVADYLRWAYRNPTVDGAGPDVGCGGEQPDGPVVFLPLGGESTTTRLCTIPAGKAILVAAAAITFSACPEAFGPQDCELATDQGVAAAAMSFPYNGPGVMEIGLEGGDTVELVNHLVVVDAWELTWPEHGQSLLYEPDAGVECALPWEEDNACGAEPGPRIASTGGWYILLEPLPEGHHTLQTRAILDWVGVSRQHTFHLEVE